MGKRRIIGMGTCKQAHSQQASTPRPTHPPTQCRRHDIHISPPPKSNSSTSESIADSEHSYSHMVLVSSDLWLGFSFLVMARASRPSLEALFADSYGSTARSAKSGWAFARAKSHRRPRRCSANIRHSTPPHSRKILETSLETLFPAAAPAGFTAKIAQGARAAKVCAKRSRSHDRGHSPAALNSRSSAPLSSKRKLEATTALTSTINRKRPLLDNFFGSDASSCQELGSGDKIAKPEAKHPRNKSTSATVARGTAVSAQPVVQISGLQVMLGETRQEPETALRKLVGLARESEAEHRQTHPKPRFDCPRCRFIVFGNAWKQGPAALTHAAHGKRESSRTSARIRWGLGIGLRVVRRLAVSVVERMRRQRAAGQTQNQHEVR